MSNYNRITFKERVRIEAGIYAKKSFSQIAKEIGRSTSSVTREVKQNRIMVKTPYSYGTDCIYPPSCRKTGLCGDEYCSKRCWTCMEHDCTGYCDRCITHTCKKTERAPFVCDSCSEKNKKACKYNKVCLSQKGKDTYHPSAYVVDNYERKAHVKSSEHFSIQYCHDLIDYFKECIKRNDDWKCFDFKFSDTEQYNDISEFYKEVELQG